MGVYICLDILPDGIDRERWRTVYMQSLQLLKAWPATLWRMDVEPFGPKYRRSFTDDLEAVDSKGFRYWAVCGDFETKQHAETFTLYEDLAYYADSGLDPYEDILLPVIKQLDGQMATVFDEKSQGHEYHHAMICVAMWIEHCFPRYAYMTGDVDLGQCQRAARHIEELLGEEVSLPLCVNSTRLFARLSQLELEKSRFDAFMELYCGNESESLGELLNTCDEEDVDGWLRERFSDYNSLRQMGAMEWFIASLNAGKDLESLLEMVCLDPAGPKFKATDFAAATASTWVAVPKDKREMMEVFQRPEGESETVYSQLGNIFFDMGGLKGRHTRVYIDKGSVLEVLERHFYREENFAEVTSTFENRHEAVLKRLEHMQDPLDKIMEKVQDSDSISDGTEFFRITDLESAPPIFMRWFDYLSRQVATWRIQVAANPEMLEHISKGRRELLFQCLLASDHNDMTLTRQTWNWIEAQQDEDLLITTLALIDDDRSMTRLFNARWAALEKAEFIEYIHEHWPDAKPFGEGKDSGDYPN